MGRPPGSACRQDDRDLRQPALERPEAIIDEIMEGAGPGPARAGQAPRDRARRGGAGPGDVVVIAGKGHEQGQEFEGGRKEPFDDAVAREALQARTAARRSTSRPPRSPRPRAALVAGAPEAAGPERVTIDSREAGTGDLFFGLPGQSADGGASRRPRWRPAPGGWSSAPITARPRSPPRGGRPGMRVSGSDRGARSTSGAPAPRHAWRLVLGCQVVGVTGSTGKTSTKDILSALLAARLRVHASRENWNTEIGLPLTILEVARGTRRSCSRWRCAARARSPSSPRSRSRTPA